MAVPIGRSDKRVEKEIAVELARADAPELKETAVAKNVSARGMRVSTEHFWRPGDRVLLTESGIRFKARVVYCQRLENNGFAVGLELLDPPKGRARRD